MDTSTEDRADPLAPIELAVTVVAALLALLLVVAIPLAVFGSGAVLGLGDEEACATVRPGTVPYGVADGLPRSEGVDGLHRDARTWPERIEVCDRHPSTGVKAAATGGGAADVAVLVGFLVLTRRLIRTARHRGLFTPAVAAATGLLGWFLLLGSLGAAVVQALADGVVISSAVDDVGWADGLRDFDMPWTLVLVGVGVLTVARVIRGAVALQDDVDATI